MDPLHHFRLHPMIHLPHIGPIDPSINMAVISMWVATALVFVIFFLASRKVSLVPKGIQNFVEVIVQFVRDEFILGIMGKEGMPYLPFILTLFVFIWFCNLSGLIPGFFTPTSNIFVTGTLAVMVFFVTHGIGIVRHGPFKYFKGWVPKGVPAALAPVLFIIEIPSAFAKPFSLAVRLFANMLAGHIAILIFLGMIIQYKSLIIAPFPVLGCVIIMILELLFTALQAYIFAILSSLYIGDAVHGGH
mgnify:CR=1 FL=1